MAAFWGVRPVSLASNNRPGQLPPLAIPQILWYIQFMDIPVEMVTELIGLLAATFGLIAMVLGVSDIKKILEPNLVVDK